MVTQVTGTKVYIAEKVLLERNHRWCLLLLEEDEMEDENQLALIVVWCIGLYGGVWGFDRSRNFTTENSRIFRVFEYSRICFTEFSCLVLKIFHSERQQLHYYNHNRTILLSSDKPLLAINHYQQLLNQPCSLVFWTVPSLPLLLLPVSLL